MSLAVLKVKTSLRSILRILSTPSYALLATAIALAVMWLFLWLFNLDLLVSVLTSSKLDWADKINFALAGFQSVATNFNVPQAVTLGVFSVLSGINLASLIYVLRHGKVSGAAGGSNVVAATAALIGSGCAVCGGSILAPLAGIFGGYISIAATKAIGTAANVIGIALLTYSIYGLGKAAANIFAKQEFSA